MPLPSVDLIQHPPGAAGEPGVRVVCPHCHMPLRVARTEPLSRAICGRCGDRLFCGTVAELNPRRFYLHIQGNDLPVVALFWSPGRHETYALNESFVAAAALIEPAARFVLVNADEHEELCGHFHIDPLPQLLVFRQGVVVARHTGDLPFDYLIAWLRTHVIHESEAPAASWPEPVLPPA